jgi:hypothetical protein
MAPGIRIWWDQDLEAYRMVTPYNKAFLELFKAAIPGSDRAWDDSSKTWSFTEKYLQGVVALTEKVFGGKATVISKDQSQKATTPPSMASSPLDKVILQFFRALPFEAAQKAYRIAAVSLHPDHGGDMEKMTALNSAWSRLEKELYGKQ